MLHKLLISHRIVFLSEDGDKTSSGGTPYPTSQHHHSNNFAALLASLLGL